MTLNVILLFETFMTPVAR